jgi:hypothetical protein
MVELKELRVDPDERRSHSRAALPGKPLYRATNIVSLKNDGRVIAAKIHAASAAALNEHFLPQVKRLMPKCLPMITVHDVRSTHGPSARNHDRRARGP